MMCVIQYGNNAINFLNILYNYLKDVF